LWQRRGHVCDSTDSVASKSRHGECTSARLGHTMERNTGLFCNKEEEETEELLNSNGF